MQRTQNCIHLLWRKQKIMGRIYIFIHRESQYHNTNEWTTVLLLVNWSHGIQETDILKILIDCLRRQCSDVERWPNRSPRCDKNYENSPYLHKNNAKGYYRGFKKLIYIIKPFRCILKSKSSPKLVNKLILTKQLLFKSLFRNISRTLIIRENWNRTICRHTFNISTFLKALLWRK